MNTLSLRKIRITYWYTFFVAAATDSRLVNKEIGEVVMIDPHYQ